MVAVKALHVGPAPRRRAGELEDSLILKQPQHRALDRLSGKMAIFAHGYSVCLRKSKGNQKGRHRVRGVGPIFSCPQKFYRTAIVYFLLYGCNLFVCEIIEVCLLWYVLPDEFVCIFNGSFLP